ncbi:50S ribosomal protein L33 [Areca yellow leaf disease phytoplasma]
MCLEKPQLQYQPRSNQSPKRLTFKKYCSYCNKHTLHQETK